MYSMTKTRWGLLAVLFATLLAAYFAPSTDDEIQPAKEIGSQVEKRVSDSVAGNINNDINLVNGLSPDLKPDTRAALDRLPVDLFYREQSKADKMINAINASKPTAPALPFIYMGKLTENGNISVFLTRNDKQCKTKLLIFFIRKFHPLHIIFAQHCGIDIFEFNSFLLV